MLDHEGFDLWADSYDRSTACSDECGSYPFAGYSAVLRNIFRRVLSHGAGDVLDIGFGTGVLTASLYQQGCHIWGQDFSEKWCLWRRQKCRQPYFTAAILRPVWSNRCYSVNMTPLSLPTPCTT